MSISKSNIPYLTHVWNPVVGCTRGCPYCWARRLCKRFKCPMCREFVPHVHPERLKLPHGKPKVVGLGFLSDLFGTSHWEVGAGAWTNLDYTVHCKFSGVLSLLRLLVRRHPEHTFVTATKCPEGIPEGFDPPDNWWLLVTATNQDEADERLPRAMVAWPQHRLVLNLEPLIGPVHLTGWAEESDDDMRDFPWCAGLIVGGMSGPKAEPMHPDWVRSIRDECAAAGVPFYFKQHSSEPGHHGWTDDLGCPVLDGRTHRDLPWRMS